MISLSRYFLLLLLLLSLMQPWQAEAQIYADVTVSGAVSGTFTISLKYVNAPVTTANFIGLATGKKGWVDPLTGNLSFTPYYNGVIFHRVIAGFMSQTGSRTGDGTDGPGYIFRNEIDSSLTHATPYTVAMARTNAWNTNGAQWYITSKDIASANVTSLDLNYTIFGVVTSGTALCDAINALPTTGSTGSPADQPLTPVTISFIKIYGPSYATFNIAPSSLPTAVSARPAMKVSGTNFSLGYDHATYSNYIGFHSADLSTWTNYYTSYYGTTAPATGNLDVSSISTGNKHFYRLARVDYSQAVNHFVPTSIAGKTLSLGSPFGTLVFVINSDATTGTWSNNGSSPSSLICAYAGLPYCEVFETILSSTYHFTLNLNYTSATIGTYSGQTNIVNYPWITGTFSSSP